MHEWDSKILVVDDEPDVLAALKRELSKQSFSVATYDDPVAALQSVHETEYSLIVSDNKMPGMSGTELLEQVKQISPDTVRIMLTGNVDLAHAIDAVNKGEIQRFIVKPWDRTVLLNHIWAGLEVYRLKLLTRTQAFELKRKNEVLEHALSELREMAIRDQMTFLYNHAEFKHQLADQIQVYKRDRQPFCLLLCDIDNFKQINDRYGHLTGDDVIRKVASTMMASLRERLDSVCRYGGEEFAAILRNTVEGGGRVVADRCVSSIASMVHGHPAGDLTVTISAGFGQYQPGWSAEEFIATVDQALYRAKRDGKNRADCVSVSEVRTPL